MSPCSPCNGPSFLSAAIRYWLGVFPVARSELRRLSHRAKRIPDRRLRSLALEAQRHKWAWLEGAAVFAAFVTYEHRNRLTRLLITLQAVLDYLDTLMEQPSQTPMANARRLHDAYLAALGPSLPQSDYYRHHTRYKDGGYLGGL